MALFDFQLFPCRLHFFSWREMKQISREIFLWIYAWNLPIQNSWPQVKIRLGLRFQTSFSDVVCLRNKASTETNLHTTSELSRFVLVWKKNSEPAATVTLYTNIGMVSFNISNFQGRKTSQLERELWFCGVMSILKPHRQGLHLLLQSVNQDENIIYPLPVV